MRIKYAKGTITTVVCVMAILLAVGCATTNKIADDIMGKGRTLRKKIAFLPTVNNSGYGGQYFPTTASTQLKAFLTNRCEGLLIIDSRNVRKALEEIPLVAPGEIDKLALAKLGRTRGLSAVLEQRIGQIEFVTEKCGIWGFRHSCMLARLSLRMRAYDVETAAALFDETIRCAVELSEDEREDAGKTGQYNKEIIHRILGKIIPKIGKKLCRRLAKEPWKGFITAASHNTFTLTAGEDVGLGAGDVLEVFAMGEPIQGYGRHVYLIPGPKIGEIKVTKVQRNRAEAMGIAGHDLGRGNCVKLNPPTG